MDEECCDMRGMLGFLILFLVSKKPMHGQEMADEIKKRKGEKPSPGTLYHAIKNLREAGFLDEKKRRQGNYIHFNTIRKKSPYCCKKKVL